jgi:hypothetical protein
MIARVVPKDVTAKNYFYITGNIFIGLLALGSISAYAKPSCILTDEEGYNVRFVEGNAVITSSKVFGEATVNSKGDLSYKFDGFKNEISFEKHILIKKKSGSNLIASIECWK